MSIFGPPPPKIIPHDAQTVPPPPYHPEPPNCMFYGWVLEPELFGPGTIVLRFDDGSGTTFKRPTTAMQAYVTFQFVAIALRLMGGIHIESPTDKRPRIASFAEAVKDVGVRSRLNDGDKMPPAAIIQKLEETLHLVKKPEWIETTRWSTPNEAMERAFNASVPPLTFKSFGPHLSKAKPATLPSLVPT
ncbi:hypothetical protein DFH09DRAFT_1140058 [Mycena vulgaris]|nr:hypothetical protein DFH09DRAFT_1140058 [Mycena vulgaris]